MFELQEGHRIIQQAIRQFCEKEIAPKVEAMESGEVLPFELMRKMAESFGIKQMAKDVLEKAIQASEKPKAEGEEKGKKKARLGEGFDLLMLAVITKEISRVSPSFALSLTGQIPLCGVTIMTKGTAEQKRKYAVPVLTFEKIGCWGLTEPGAGSDAFSLRTIAKPDGDYYVLNGSKTFITNAPYADVFIIYAKIDRGAEAKQDKRRVYPFVLERGIGGLSTSKPMKKMGMCGSPTGEIFLDDVRVPKDQLLGGEEKASREQAKEVLSSEREGSPFMCWGIIERCIDDCVKYAIQRKQFGKSIADFQLIQEKIADMYIRLENVRNLAFKQAWAMKSGGGAAEDFCAAKAYSAHAAVEVGLEAIQLMGGYGYMKEYVVEMLMRDAKLIEIGGGTTEIQKLTIAKELFRKAGHEISLY